MLVQSQSRAWVILKALPPDILLRCAAKSAACEDMFATVRKERQKSGMANCQR